jgi:transcriptional regulator with XRE-family HTH domain
MLARACANERIMLGLTQQQLADPIGVTYQQAHKYERGINGVAAGRLYKVAQVLGVDISYFFKALEGAVRFGRRPSSACCQS